MQFEPLTPALSVLASLITLIGVIVIGRIGRRTAELAREPGVIGELVIGIVVSNFGAWLNFPLALKLFHWTETTAQFRRLSFPIAPSDASTLTLWLFSNIGLLLLMFHVGLENSFSQLKKVLRPATKVAVIGVVVPFVLGWLVTQMLSSETTLAMRLFVGGTLAATSIAITARVLKDAGLVQTFEAQVVLGAAVIDDILGLLLLAGVSTWAAGVTHFGTLIFNGVIVLAYLAGAWVSARARMFARLAKLEDWLAPIFFVVTGMQIDLKLFTDPPTLELALVLTVAAVIGKLFAGLGVAADRRRWFVGTAMIPRGEIGLVFASFGRSFGLFSDEVFAAILLMVFVTSAVTPLLLQPQLASLQRKR